MTSRGGPKRDSRDRNANGERDAAFSARLTGPLRVTSDVTSTEMYALPRRARDDATGRGRSDGAFAYVVLVSRHVVLATPYTVKPAVDSGDQSWSVARVTVAPAGTATVTRASMTASMPG